MKKQVVSIIAAIFIAITPQISLADNEDKDKGKNNAPRDNAPAESSGSAAGEEAAGSAAGGISIGTIACSADPFTTEWAAAAIETDGCISASAS